MSDILKLTQKVLRKELETCTQVDLAKRLGLYPSHLSKLLAKKTSEKLEIYDRILHTLGYKLEVKDGE